jgi:hypothetical protein
LDTSEPVLPIFLQPGFGLSFSGKAHQQAARDDSCGKNEADEVSCSKAETVSAPRSDRDLKAGDAFCRREGKQ